MGGQGSGKNTSPIRKINVMSISSLERTLLTNHFKDFIPEAFEVLESGDAYASGVRDGVYQPRYTPGWHIDALAEHLQAVAEGQIKRLLINIPPGTSKSVVTCVLWPAWLWARDPSMRYIFSSYSEEFTKRDTRKAKELLTSNWYRTLFPHVVLKSSPDTMMEHHTTAGGERHGASTQSGVTGKHVHGVVEDDPLKLQDAQSRRARDEAWNYHTQALGFRLLPEAGWRVVVMQRLHEDDPSGRILAANKAGDVGEQYEHLMLPMEFERARKCITYIRKPDAEPTPLFEDPRKQEGELLWPARMGPIFVAEKKSPQGLGAYGYAGQAQQRPAPAAGGIIQRTWLRYYTDHPPISEMVLEQSWDLIFSDDGPGSYVVGQVWGQHGANHYLLHQYRNRVDFVSTLHAVLAMTRAWPTAMRKKVEKKANGAALLAVLGAKVPGMIPITPKGSKGARTLAVSPLFEAGNIWVPDKAQQPWVAEWEEEVVGMTPEGPSTGNDDQADCTTQYLADKGVIGETQVFNLDLSVGVRESPWRQFG